MQWVVLPIFLLSLQFAFLQYNSERGEGESGVFVFLSDNVELLEDQSRVDRGAKAKQNCNSEKLMNLLNKLQVFSPESVIVIAASKKFDNICYNVSQTQKSADDYLKTCTLMPDQDVYNHLFSGVRMLVKKICTSSPYRQSFLEFAQCYSKLKTEFDSCIGPKNWSENLQAEKLCKAYQEIIDCYFLKTSVQCGNKAAEIFKELIVDIINSVILVSCSGTKFTGFNKNVTTSSQAACFVHSWTLYIPLLYVFSVIFNS